MEDLTRDVDWCIDWNDPRDVPVGRRQARARLRQLRDETGAVMTDDEIEAWLDEADEKHDLQARRLGFTLRPIGYAIEHPGSGDSLRLTLTCEISAVGPALARIRQALIEHLDLWARIIPPGRRW